MNILRLQNIWRIMRQTVQQRRTTKKNQPGSKFLMSIYFINFNQRLNDSQVIYLFIFILKYAQVFLETGLTDF